MASTNSFSALDNISHVIVLMFENRSFDHILGGMPGVDGVLDGNGQPRQDVYNTMHPTQPPGNDNPPTLPIPITPFYNPDPPLKTESDYIVHDFTHEFGDGMSQDLYGPGTLGVLGGMPQGNPSQTFPPTSSGFLSTIAYNVTTPKYPPNGDGALTYFNRGSMKVFHTLAESFVICDAWYCDMPGHTGPNRAFMHCGTTGDLGINDNDDVARMVNRPTVFESIQQKGQTWKVYTPNGHSDTNWLNEQVLSQQYDSADPDAANVTNVPIGKFFNDLTNGNLPFYSFIMCWSDGGLPDTSMHPQSRVEPGENLLACIYNALQASSYWSKTLLVVTFDENGGMFDHAAVPQATAPDYDIVGDRTGYELPPVFGWHSNFTNRTYSFDFSILGVRIPVLLISPWLRAGVTSMQLQNTSVIRFLQDMLPGEPSTPYFLTQRDRTAPSFAPVFDYGELGSQQLRTDCPANISGYSGFDPCSQFMADITPTADSLAKRPTPHIAHVVWNYIAALPGHPDSGKRERHEFATVGEMRDYARERLEAGVAYARAKKYPRELSGPPSPEC